MGVPIPNIGAGLHKVIRVIRIHERGNFYMSKFKNWAAVPEGIKGTFSLSEFGALLGIKPAKRHVKAMKCIKCGSAMRRIADTNVWVCDGQIEKEENGVKKMVACGHRAVSSVNPAVHKSSEGSDDHQGKKPGKGKRPGKIVKSAEA